MHTTLDGLLLIGGYALFVAILMFGVKGKKNATKEAFLVANRNVKTIPAALSIAAAWVWAPALFLSAQKSYTQGWVGLFWFLAPNILCLVLFAFFAQRVVNLLPNGFSHSGNMRVKLSRRVQILYIIELVGLACCSFAVQLIAGGQVIAALTQIPYWAVIVLLACIPVTYTWYGGVRASVRSDVVQLSIILLIGASIMVALISNSGGWYTVAQGLGGISGEYKSLTSEKGLHVLLTFGIPATIGLLSGPFGDQSFWQRAYSVERHSVKSAFLLAAAIFALVPIIMSISGFVAAGSHITVIDASRVNVSAVQALLPEWVIVPFVWLLLSGLVTKLDTNLSAIASIGGHDLSVAGDYKIRARASMIVLVVVGVTIAYVVGTYIENPILYLFLLYGTLRSSVLVPTLLTFYKQNVSEQGVFWGIIVSLVGGLPIFAYGNLQQQPLLIVGGSLFTVTASGILTFAFTLFEKRVR